MLLLVFCVGRALAAQDDWQQVSIPEAWKKPAAGQGGYAWYRCLVRVPASWEGGRVLRLFFEPVDDAREVYLNGVRVASAGSFPPQFRSGLGGSDLHPLEAAEVKFGELNVIAMRVYNNDGRSGFNVAAPAIFAGDQAMRLAGSWQTRGGDDAAWAQSDPQLLAGEVVFDKVQPASEVETLLRQLPGEEGPLSVTAALQRFQTPDDLVVEAVLSEPEIGQPLFIDFDERGRLWVLNYKQYPNPAGLTAVSRDQFLRTVYDKVPPPPPHHFPGRDKITIHEDADGDGSFETHQTFVDGLSLATSFARGRGGVFVLNPPYLLFYADADQDDQPDGDPEVLLEGFGIEDSHSLASNLRWGPDGWLYAAQGSTVTGQIKRYGSQDKPVHSMGQLIWRYHPETRRYEIFAEGGGNTFGVEIDAKGRIYSGHNGGDTRGFHYIQGGYYQKSFGKHGELSNPYAFGHFAAMSHHAVPRFTHQWIIYEGAALSAKYAGRLFGVGPLQSHVVISDVQPAGASFSTTDIGHALTSSDPWFRPVHIDFGPDGALYVCDFYEQRIDHASHYQGRVTPDLGRIYRLRAPESRPHEPFDYGQLPSARLVSLLEHENRWHRQIALRLLADRRDAYLRQPLRALVLDSGGQLALEALWAANLSGAFDEEFAAQTLAHSDPYVRAWTVRLLCDDHTVSNEVARRLAEVAENEQHLEVRCQLACSTRRLPPEQALPIVRNLITHDEDAGDVFLPLSLWWAIEAHAEEGRDAVLALFADNRVWKRPLVQQHLAERVMRRYALAGAQRDLTTCAQLFELAPTPADAQLLLKGFEAAFSGRTLGDLPPELVAALAKVGGGSLALRLRRGDPTALAEASLVVADQQADPTQRLELIQVLGQIKQDRVVPVLLGLLAAATHDDIRAASISALQGYDDPRIGAELARQHGSFSSDVRALAQSVLVSRRAWAKEMLSAVDRGAIPPADIPPAILQKLLLLNDDTIRAGVRQHWGEVPSSTTEEMLAEMQRLGQVLLAAAGNPYRGKQLFETSCGKCHQLFSEGGRIGPDLTPYKRDDLRGVLMNVVNPSLEIREGFENYLVITQDGRTLNGFVEEQDNRIVVLKTADGQRLIIPRDDIETMQAIRRSIMPEEILKPLSEQQVRDLFAYLRGTQPLP